MPIYEFTCKKCGSTFEALTQGDEKISCQSCGSSSLKKLFSLFAVQKPKPASVAPACAGECPGGFNRGACGSGMCGAR